MGRADQHGLRRPSAGAITETRAGLAELLVDSVPDAVFVLDPEGRVVTWNPAAVRLLGYQHGEVLGRHVAVLYPQRDIEAGKPDQDLAIAVADGRLEEEAWRVRHDGGEFWADVVLTALRGPDARLLGFGALTRDLTERKRGEEALRESEERFRLLVSSVADYAIFLLDPDGRIASWNLGAERLKGYRADEVLGRDLATFYTEADRRAGLPAAALEQARAEGRWVNEGWRVRKDGSRFWASVVITRLVGRDGVHRGFAKVTRDLTDRKRSEDALRGILERERVAAEQLREVDRLRRDLVSMVAHDLRSPVGVIQSYLQMLRDDWETSTEREKLDALERLADRTETLSTLVDDVLDLVRIDSGHLQVAVERFDLSAVVERVVLDAQATARDCAVVLHPTVPVWACGDPHRTWQVLSNLVSNGVKFTASGSKVEVSVVEQGAEAVVEVLDHGPGIAAEDHEVIFERFSRLAGASGTSGSGLGLFIARELAEAQHGRIEVGTGESGGAVFRLVLPAVP